MDLTRELLIAAHDLVYKCVWYEYTYKKETRAGQWTLENLSNNIRRIQNEMAAKKPTSKLEKPQSESIKWINRNLTDEEKDDHDATKVTPQALFKDLLGLVIQGYNVAVKFDSYSSCFQATLIPYNKNDVNYGYGLSARSAQPDRAISLLLFKHFRVMGENWAQYYNAPKSSFEG